MKRGECSETVDPVKVSKRIRGKYDQETRRSGRMTGLMVARSGERGVRERRIPTEVIQLSKAMLGKGGVVARVTVQMLHRLLRVC